MAALMDTHSGQSEPSVNLTNHREADGETNKVKKKNRQAGSCLNHNNESEFEKAVTSVLPSVGKINGL